ncbi:MarR family winged helix-turn-helix transcriptional regulator [Kineococcus rhizosphaerae]|uniref:DNA-binding MarR family transcriptional regulator n=1 Tax=Kineococcus rhizosphaerae TaxID=559628 RepID=A0A2T0QYM5_9ACTN|nr:MarR family transcriptional regulator [Kineococcus rhizosphaerae]PRY11473.1 DNA-binding MarR family transcriptional regulator [Kineococcus rhizosphaerae]
MDDLDADLFETLRSLQWRLRRTGHGDVDDLGITPAQGRVLRVVGRCDTPPRMGAVAERLHIAPRSLTDLVDPLEAAGLLRRTTDPDNRRSVLLDLTPRGGVVLDALRQRARRSAARAFSVLEVDERRQLLDLLRRVESAVAEDPAAAHG